jgi:hypothetical protein
MVKNVLSTANVKLCFLAILDKPAIISATSSKGLPLSHNTKPLCLS